MGIPTNYIKKRDFLHHEKTSVAALTRTGREFFALERYSDALDFFEKARDKEDIAKIKAVALERGDTFLLARLDRYDRTLVTPADWEAAAVRADRENRSSMADFARRKLAPPPAQPAITAPIPEQRPGEAPLAEG